VGKRSQSHHTTAASMPVLGSSVGSNSKTALVVWSGEAKNPKYSLAGCISFKKQVYNERKLDIVFLL
jgi:hypothetical protein